MARVRSSARPTSRPPLHHLNECSRARSVPCPRSLAAPRPRVLRRARRAAPASLLGHEIGEREPTLASRETSLADERAVGLERDPTCEENLRSDLLTVLLPTSCLGLGATS